MPRERADVATDTRAKLSTVILIIVAFSLAITGCGTQEGEQDGGGEEAQSLRLVSFLATNHQLTRDVIPMWINMVEERTDGAVEIEWVGPEAIPPGDQFDAVSGGVADIGFNVGTYYENQVPSAPSLHLSPYTPAEERDTEYFNYLVDQHEQAGVTYLGRWLAASPFYFWSNNRTESIEDFQGQTFRSNPTYHAILSALGASTVDVPPGDVYTSLERGVVEGFGFPVLGPRESGWTEVTDFIINEPFLVQNGTILINPSTFESLPPDVQEGMREATAEFEPQMTTHFEEAEQREWEAIQEAGVEVTQFSPDDSQQFRELWMDVYWETLEERVPDQVEELQELLPRSELKARFEEVEARTAEYIDN